MVAYSFKRQFVDPIRAGTKLQTIRGPRKRHAMPGEALQLYTGMRTRSCEKIIPDPQCIAVEPISVEVENAGFGRVFLNGQWLDSTDQEALAVADGFASDGKLPALQHMWRFWFKEHGPGDFNGYVIKWRP